MTDEIHTELKAIKQQQNRIEGNQAIIIATLAVLASKDYPNASDEARNKARKTAAQLKLEEA